MATIKQIMAFKQVVKGVPITRAMANVGYSKTTAERTNKLTRSAGWKELMEKTLSDKALLKVHKQGLKAMRKRAEIVERDEKGAPVYQYFEEIDHNTRHKYL